MQNSKNNYASNFESSIKSGSLKMIMSLRTEMLRIELRDYILLLSDTRKLQRQYYKCQQPVEKKVLLALCKAHEARMERDGNRIWKEYKLGDIPRRK